MYLEHARGGLKFAQKLAIHPIGAAYLILETNWIKSFWNQEKGVRAEDADIDTFSSFIDSADDYNVLLPISLHPKIYRPAVNRADLITPNY